MKKFYPFNHLGKMVLPLFFICCAFSAMADGHFSWSVNKAEAAFACDTAPPISCPSTYYGCPGSSIDPSVTGFAIAQAGDADCPNPVLTYTDLVMSTGPCTGEIFIKRIWTANYPNNTNPWLLSDCTQLISIEDKQDPTVACPNNVVVANSCNTVSWPTAGSGDNCGIASLNSNIASGSYFNVGTTAVTYTAVDNCGNTATCSFNVTVQQDCCGAPSINGPATYNGCISDSTDPSVTGQASATGSSSTCQTPTMTYNDATTGTGTCTITITRTWTATDPTTGATTTFVQQINLRDNSIPSITNCPADILLPEGASFAMWQDPAASDDCGIASFNSTHPSGSSFAEGVTTVTYTATDFCGNVATCSFNVTVPQSCNSAPVITCPDNYVGCLAAPVIRSATGIATASNNGGDACGDPLITYSDVTTSEGPCKGEFVLQRTWSATEQNSNLTSTCIQSITIKDDIAPTIINCPANITVPANTYTASWSLPTANDDCGIDSFGSTHNSGQTFPVGTTKVTYTALDQCGNTTTCSFTVTVNETCQATPVITCPADYSACIGTSTDPATTGQATASITGSMCGTPVITYVDQTTNGPCAGQVSIQRTWTATEPSSNLAVSCVQNIFLRDIVAPTIANCPANITLPNNTYIATWSLPAANDNCGVASFISSHNSGDVFTSGTTTVTYTATDNCGNASTCTFSVTVTETCTTPPTITCPGDYIGCPGTALQPTVTGLAAAINNGNLCGQPQLTYVDDTLSVGPCAGQIAIRREWIATGSGTGLTATCFQSITLGDSQGPSITNCPSNITATNNSQVSWSLPTATDNCGVASFTSNHNSGGSFSAGTTTVTYTATDNCGQTATCSFNVTVNQTCQTAPAINCPANYTGCIGSSTDPATTGQATATATGAQCSTPVLSYSDQTVANGACNGAAVSIDRTWTATEPNSGLTSTCVQRITLSDASNPVINNCPSNISVLASNPIVTWNLPTASDDCGIASFSSTRNSGDVFPVGNTTVTYTATDNCGNSTTCSFTVSVAQSCSTQPVINCPANYTGCPGTSISPSLTGQAAVANAASACGTATITYADVVLQTFACTGGQEIQRTWTATYPNNTAMTATCIQKITLNDAAGPSLTACPSDITSANPIATWTPPTINSSCGGYTLTSSHNSGDAFPIGTTTVTYSVTDNCNNTISCNFDVTIIDNQGSGSSFTNCPNDIVVDCNGTSSNVTWDVPQFTSACSSACADSLSGYLYMGEYNGHKYFCSVAPATWPEADAHAKSLGGNLAIIQDAQENAFLANILTIQSAFIGCSDGVVEGDFIWTDGTPVTYTNWYPGQPNNYQNYQDYCELLSNGQWNDQYNHVKLEYIVELSCSSVRQTAGPAPGSAFGPGSTTIEYTATDGCGNSEVCSFDVVVGGGLSLECIPDQQVACPSSAGVQVTWAMPTAHTCCNNCSSATPSPIAGFIYMGTKDNSHYYCSNEPALWNDAQSVSMANGGHLAIINSASENAYLAGLLAIQSAYIGLSDSGTEGTFQWVDGSGLGYNNWYPGQPNDYQQNQDYVELLANGQWNDQYNNKPLEYIMEIPACLNVVQTGGPANGSVLPVGVTTITYQATDACGNTAQCSFDINVVKTNNANATACNASGDNSSKAWIQKVKFGPLYNVSGNNGGYARFQGCNTYYKGAAQSLSLTPGYSGSAYSVAWSVYADWNQDGDFSDNGEYIATGTGTQTLSGTIRVPSTAKSGQTRLRVIMKKGTTADNACSTFAQGEVEDYCINVASSSNFSSGRDDQYISIPRSETIELDQIIKSGSARTSDNSLNDQSAIQTNSQTTEIRVYPNPATDIIYVQNSHYNEGSIYDAHGKMVRQITSQELLESQGIDVSTYSTGVYHMRLSNDQGEVKNERFVVQQR